VGEEHGAQAFIDLWEREVTPLRPAERERMRSFDFIAMQAAAQDRDGLESILAEIRVPCLLFAGTADDAHPRARQAAGEIPGAEFVSLPGLHHGETMARADLVVPLVREFLLRCGL
jgi:pimeloyl-ACP methyl ester carboxylesterase